MAPRVTPWEYRPAYLAATSTEPVFRDQMRYDVPRQFPITDPTDRTAYHPGQQDWSIDNPPDILYQIYPDNEWYRFMHAKLPGPKVDGEGRVVLESWPPDPTNPRVLLNFSILVKPGSYSEYAT
ncbi:hypothetical protein MMC26_006041 [Xylographa opegraphella]|nr:hypothetical protein [Xylographa opegraphella]